MLDPDSEIQATLLRNHTGCFPIALLNALMAAESSHTADMVPEDLLHRPIGSGYFAIALSNALMTAESSRTADMVPEDLLHRPVGCCFMSTAAFSASSSWVGGTEMSASSSVCSFLTSSSLVSHHFAKKAQLTLEVRAKQSIEKSASWVSDQISGN